MSVGFVAVADVRGAKTLQYTEIKGEVHRTYNSAEQPEESSEKSESPPLKQLLGEVGADLAALADVR